MCRGRELLARCTYTGAAFNCLTQNGEDVRTDSRGKGVACAVQSTKSACLTNRRTRCHKPFTFSNLFFFFSFFSPSLSKKHVAMLHTVYHATRRIEKQDPQEKEDAEEKKTEEEKEERERRRVFPRSCRRPKTELQERKTRFFLSVPTQTRRRYTRTERHTNTGTSTEQTYIYICT